MQHIQLFLLMVLEQVRERRLTGKSEQSSLCTCMSVCDLTLHGPWIIQGRQSARSALYRSTHLRSACGSLSSRLSDVTVQAVTILVD